MKLPSEPPIDIRLLLSSNIYIKGTGVVERIGLMITVILTKIHHSFAANSATRNAPVKTKTGSKFGFYLLNRALPQPCQNRWSSDAESRPDSNYVWSVVYSVTVCVYVCSKGLQGPSDIHEELRLESSASMIDDCKTKT